MSLLKNNTCSIDPQVATIDLEEHTDTKDVFNKAEDMDGEYGKFVKGLLSGYYHWDIQTVMAQDDEIKEDQNKENDEGEGNL